MAKVKLIKGLSYSGIVRATKEEPVIEVADDLLEEVLDTGYFVEVRETKPKAAEKSAEKATVKDSSTVDTKPAKQPGKKTEQDVQFGN